MPYSNIVWVKLFWKQLLHDDDRFIGQLNDEQKGLYLCLLLLAGATNNNIKNDENYIKRVLNLSENTQKIRENLEKIFQVFPKILVKDGFLKFKNFKKFHNYLKDSQRKPEGTPQDSTRIEEIIREYIKKRRYTVVNEDGSKNKEIINALFKRNCRTAKQMLLMTKGKSEPIIKAIDWFGSFWDSKNLSWTLETIEKWLPEYLSKGESIAQEQLRKDFGLK